MCRTKSVTETVSGSSDTIGNANDQKIAEITEDKTMYDTRRHCHKHGDTKESCEPRIAILVERSTVANRPQFGTSSAL